MESVNTTSCAIPVPEFFILIEYETISPGEIDPSLSLSSNISFLTTSSGPVKIGTAIIFKLSTMWTLSGLPTKGSLIKSGNESAMAA